MADTHAGGGRAEALAIAGIPHLGTAGRAGSVVFGGICQDFQLALHVHIQIPLILFMNRQTANSIDSSIPVSFILEHIMNK